MNISKLIDHLKIVQAIHGDVRVYVWDDGTLRSADPIDLSNDYDMTERHGIVGLAL